MPAITTPEDFAAYLRTLDPETPFAVTCKSGECPLAQWLKCQGAEEPDVLSAFAQTEPGENLVPLPEWAKAFVARIDQRGRYAGERRPIAPAEALETLYRVL